jgi:hypothetical protein
MLLLLLLAVLIFQCNVEEGEDCESLRAEASIRVAATLELRRQSHMLAAGWAVALVRNCKLGDSTDPNPSAHQPSNEFYMDNIIMFHWYCYEYPVRIFSPSSIVQPPYSQYLTRQLRASRELRTWIYHIHCPWNRSISGRRC